MGWYAWQRARPAPTAAVAEAPAAAAADPAAPVALPPLEGDGSVRADAAVGPQLSPTTAGVAGHRRSAGQHGHRHRPAGPGAHAGAQSRCAQAGRFLCGHHAARRDDCRPGELRALRHGSGRGGERRAGEAGRRLSHPRAALAGSLRAAGARRQRPRRGAARGGRGGATPDTPERSRSCRRRRATAMPIPASRRSRPRKSSCCAWARPTSSGCATPSGSLPPPSPPAVADRRATERRPSSLRSEGGQEGRPRKRRAGVFLAPVCVQLAPCRDASNIEWSRSECRKMRSAVMAGCRWRIAPTSRTSAAICGGGNDRSVAVVDQLDADRALVPPDRCAKRPPPPARPFGLTVAADDVVDADDRQDPEGGDPAPGVAVDAAVEAAAVLAIGPTQRVDDDHVHGAPPRMAGRLRLGDAGGQHRYRHDRQRRPNVEDQARSKRSRFITLVQAPAKSCTNFSLASSQA